MQLCTPNVIFSCKRVHFLSLIVYFLSFVYCVVTSYFLYMNPFLSAFCCLGVVFCLLSLFSCLWSLFSCLLSLVLCCLYLVSCRYTRSWQHFTCNTWIRKWHRSLRMTFVFRHLWKKGGGQRLYLMLSISAWWETANKEGDNWKQSILVEANWMNYFSVHCEL